MAKKFGLKQAKVVVIETADITTREVKVAVTFLKASGVKLVVAEETGKALEAKLAAQAVLTEGIEAAEAGLVELDEMSAAKLKEIAEGTDAMIKSIESAANVKAGKISEKAERKIVDLQAKIRAIDAAEDAQIYKIGDELGAKVAKVKEQESEAVLAAADNFANQMENTRKMIADAKADLMAAGEEVNILKKIASLFS